MSFRWLYLRGPKEVSGESQPFPSQEAAEEWMGSAFSELLDAGHLAASLVNEDEEIYTMKLTEDRGGPWTA